MNKPIRRFLLAATASLSLAACARSEPETANENLAVETPPAPETVTDPVPPAAAAETPTPAAEANAAAELPPEAAAAPDEQMLDDASATGMTARAARGEEDAPTANVQE